jgi:O-antigen/teichoic acid export membrane protein
MSDLLVGNEAEVEAVAAAPVAGRRSLPMLANALALIFGRVVTMSLGFFSWLLAAHLLARADVGLAGGTIAAMMLCVQIALLGIGSAVIAEFPRAASPQKLLATALTLVAGASIATAALFLLVARAAFEQLGTVASDPKLALLFVGMALFGTINLFLDHVSTVQRRGDHVLARGAVTGLLILVIVVALPKLFGIRDAGVIFLAWTVGGACATTLGLLQLRRTVGFRPRLAVDRAIARRLVHIGIPNYLLTVVERAPNSLVPIVVVESLGRVENAYWYAAWMMAWLLYFVPISVGMTVFAEASHEPGALRRHVERGLKISLALGVAGAAVLAVLAHLLLRVLGPSYARDGSGALRILVIAVVPVVLVQAYFAACRATHKLNEAIIAGAITVVLAVAGAVAATEHWGSLEAVAVAWLAAQTAAGLFAVGRLRAVTMPRVSVPFVLAAAR